MYGSRVLAILVLAVVSLAGVELALRIAAPVERCDQSTRLVFEQHTAGLAVEVVYQRNTLGLRTAGGREIDASAAQKRILCLGASTTDQAMQSWPDTWCGTLETLLNSAGIPVQAASFGRGGMNASDAADALERLLPLVRPDLVVTLLGVNDLTWRRATPSERIGATIDCPPPVTLVERCARGSQICRRLDAARASPPATAPARELEWHEANLPDIRRRFRELPPADAPAPAPESRANLAASVRRLATLIRTIGARLLVLGQPVLWKEGMTEEESARLWFPVQAGPTSFVRAPPAWLANEMRDYNRVQEDAARSNGAPYVELDDVVPKDLGSYFDDCHLTDRGSANVARAAFEPARALLRSPDA
jgi:lysophospholipase L1-like esterase